MQPEWSSCRSRSIVHTVVEWRLDRWRTFEERRRLSEMMEKDNVRFSLDLLRWSTRCGIGHCPCGFFACLMITMFENIDQRWKDIRISHGLENNERTDRLLSGMSFRLTWIWLWMPAVMFERVQQASFLIDSLGLWSKVKRCGRTPASSTSYSQRCRSG